METLNTLGKIYLTGEENGCRYDTIVRKGTSCYPERVTKTNEAEKGREIYCDRNGRLHHFEKVGDFQRANEAKTSLAACAKAGKTSWFYTKGDRSIDSLYQKGLRMKIVLDTNVLVSAFISKHGKPAVLLDLILTFSEVQLITSKPILEELESVLRRKEVRERFGYSMSDIESFIRAVQKVSLEVKIKSDFKVVAEDPKDNLVLNTAYDGKADYVVSGDKHLKGLKKFKGIKIVNPAQMIEIILKEFEKFIFQGL